MSKCSLSSRAPEQRVPERPVTGLPDQDTLQEITRRARTARGCEEHRRDRSSTAYMAEFGDKRLDEPTWRRMRPSSPTRMNKPHPPEVFLVTRLRHIPGYYNCDRRSAADQANGISSLPKSTQMSIPKLSQHGRIPSHAFYDSSTHLAAEAWMKLARERDCAAIRNMLSSDVDTERKKLEMGRKTYIHQALARAVRPEAAVSAHRWLKKADAEETAVVERLLKTLSSGSPHWPLLVEKNSTNHRGRIKNTTTYQIHPEWPWRN